MARLADVAREAGIAKSTVSRAFIHPEMVAEATRERIVQVARELNFTPNRAARALTTGKTGLIGLVVPTLSNPFFAPLVLGAQRAAEVRDRHTLVVSSEYSRDREKVLVQRLAREVEGFVMVSPVGSDRFLSRVASERPLVLVDRKVGRLPAVLIDTPTGLAEVTAGLLADGHRHIGYISGPPDSWLDTRRLAAVQAAAERDHATLSVFGPLAPTVDSGISIADAVLHSGVTAAIGYNSSIVLGLLVRLGIAGGPASKKIVVASADSLIRLGGGTHTEVIALDAPVEEAGYAAVNKLSALLANENPPRVDTLLARVVR